ncbi:YihY/virulence factor BrkB family protein [Peterkaempfera sp. SMS 1(5)a]|uniref:YihY/virulence factor BrkB family protein n=1 Tax=Peterkaempfera podocarpi TaxID=3232308 RepID=UPI00366CFFB9
MDFLTRLPLIGPLIARLLRTRAYRVYEHCSATGCNRLAGAVTFFGFLALFPLLTLALAAAAATLSDHQVKEIQQKIAEQIPGIADSLNINSLASNAGAVGLVSGVVLLISGLGWVDTMRAAIRTVWQLDAEPGNPVIRKLLDVGVLVGLGVVTAVSLGASAVFSALTGRLAEALGLERSGAGAWLLGLAGFIIAVAADMILFAYLLTAFPRITDQRRRTVLAAALIGAVGFEVLKVLLSSYISGVAGKSVYGAFGVPVALLLWINFVSRLLLYCASWTATADQEAARSRAREQALRAYHDAGGTAAAS